MFQLISLRILHIVFGNFWVGTDMFSTLLLLPHLKSLGPQVERPVMGALLRSLPPVLTASSVTTLMTGVWLAGWMRGWSFDWVMASNWGWTMLVAFIATMAAVIVGSVLLGPLSARYEKLNLSIEMRSLTPAEKIELQQLGSKVTALARFNTSLLMIALLMMAIVRYV